MPDDHRSACNKSAALCDELFRELKSRLKGIPIRRSARYCCFGNPRFAWINHRKKTSRIDVWCIGESQILEDRARAKGLDFARKHSVFGDGRFVLTKHTDISDLADILIEVSLAATTAKGMGRAKRKLAIIPEEVAFTDGIPEGAVTTIQVNRYERSKKAREVCIAHYGPICQVCSFDFFRKYGETGRDFIHVHHLKPLSGIKKGYRVNPIQDLLPVCPNCHAVIHLREPAFSVDEMKRIIANAQSE